MPGPSWPGASTAGTDHEQEGLHPPRVADIVLSTEVRNIVPLYAIPWKSESRP